MTQQMLHDTRILSAKQAADVLGVDKSTITRWSKSGHLPTMGRAGDSALSQLVFLADDVELLRQKRTGEAGDVLDRIDLHAAASEPTEDRNAATRAEWLEGIRYVAKRNGGTFHSGLVRPLVSEEARGPAVGALITGLIRSHRIEWTGDYDTLRDPRARHAESPCKVYRVIGDLA